MKSHGPDSSNLDSNHTLRSLPPRVSLSEYLTRHSQYKPISMTIPNLLVTPDQPVTPAKKTRPAANCDELLRFVERHQHAAIHLAPGHER